MTYAGQLLNYDVKEMEIWIRKIKQNQATLEDLKEKLGLARFNDARDSFNLGTANIWGNN